MKDKTYVESLMDYVCTTMQKYYGENNHLAQVECEYGRYERRDFDQTIVAIREYIKYGDTRYFTNKDRTHAWPGIREHMKQMDPNLVRVEVIKHALKWDICNQFTGRSTRLYGDNVDFTPLSNPNLPSDDMVSLLAEFMKRNRIEVIDYLFKTKPFLYDILVESYVITRYRSIGYISADSLDAYCVQQMDIYRSQSVRGRQTMTDYESIFKQMDTYYHLGKHESYQKS